MRALTTLVAQKRKMLQKSVDSQRQEEVMSVFPPPLMLKLKTKKKKSELKVRQGAEFMSKKKKKSVCQQFVSVTCKAGGRPHTYDS